MAPRPVALPKTHILPQVLPVFDQLDIGSCTANMGCYLMAWLEHQQAQQEVTFSRLFLYAATRQIEGTPIAEDSGAEIRSVMKALAKSGTCLEKSWSYDHPFSTEPGEAAKSEALDHQALFYYRCGTLRALCASLVQGFPVGFGFSVPENMMSDEAAHTGAVLYPETGERFEGGHAVTAWGYDDDKVVGREQGAVLCLNSWSQDWGLGGYFWLPYRFFTEKLALDLWTLRRIEL